MSQNEAHTRFTRLKWRRAFDRWRGKAALLVIAAKGGFDPDQPRAPAGNPDGGQWTGGGGSGEGPILSDANPDNFWKPGSQVAQAGKKPPKIKLPTTGKSRRGGSPTEPPPQFPKKKPPTNKERLGHARTAARWLTIAVAGRYFRAGAIIVRAIHETGWLDELRGFIGAAFDPPKSLRQLQKEAFEPASGYDIHHIVEQTAARNAGFSDNLINAPENLVRIPRIRHWEINKWYSRPNEDFIVNGKSLSPREFLRDKDWDLRTKVGLKALKKYEVLK